MGPKDGLIWSWGRRPTVGRFRFNFAILTGRKTFRNLRTDSPLRLLLETVRSELTEREGATLEFTSDGLNAMYDAAFINTASGDELDLWGETLDLPRNASETDADYRARLLAELRDFTSCLTVDALADAVQTITSERPELIDVHTLAPDWPFEWWEDIGSENVTWCNWLHLADFLVVLQSEPSASELSQIAAKMEELKFAPTRCLVVTDSGSGYYELKKLVE